MKPSPPFFFSLDFPSELLEPFSVSVEPRGVVVLDDDECDVIDVGLGLGFGFSLGLGGTLRAGLGAPSERVAGGTVMRRSGPGMRQAGRGGWKMEESV